ncbi:MAG: hypothetical protein N2255_01825, partial [Kiritimatiellae bacterium]|nr:hypothetical protein [Kiritimatiellia bacterium]
MKRSEERVYDSARSRILVGKIPEEVVDTARKHGLTDENCLFAISSDLDIEGNPCQTWLIVGSQTIISVALPPSPLQDPLVFPVGSIQKTRMFQTVGAAFLQFKIEGYYLHAIRFSNAHRESFGRARIQIDRLLRKQPFQPDALTRPSDWLCEKCGLPLSSRQGECPRCARRQGILMRSLALMSPYRGAIALLLVTMLAGVG